jgi:hypothetical protein
LVGSLRGPVELVALSLQFENAPSYGAAFLVTQLGELVQNLNGTNDNKKLPSFHRLFKLQL